MDTSQEVHYQDSTGWQRGLYDDLRETFRAPIVNWIFRTLMANEPDFLRYAWSQVKPVYETKAFAEYTVEYRDAVLSTLEAETDLPVYGRDAVDVSPAEYRELRSQVATFDVMAPKLAFLFEVSNRTLHDESVGRAPSRDLAATAPVPDWVDADRGGPVTMIAPGNVPDAVAETVEDVKAFHGFDEGLPSIYRCLGQWPPYLNRAWEDYGSIFRSEAFERACDEADDVVRQFRRELAYRPRLAPDDLRNAGFDDETIADCQSLFAEFDSGPVETVVPALPVYANSVDAGGPREW